MKKIGFLIVLALQLSFLSAQKIDTFYIDSAGNGNFTTFTSAVTFLQNNGVKNPTVVLIKNGHYPEDIFLGEFSGASIQNNIVFKGIGTNVEIRSFDLKGTKFLTLENITICKHYDATIRLSNDCKYITIRNCNIIQTSCAWYGILISSRASGLKNGTNASYISIENNLFQAPIGIGLCDDTARSSNIVIRNNTFKSNKEYNPNNNFYNGIVAEQINGISIIGNCVSSTDESNYADAFRLVSVSDFEISCNIINRAQGGIFITTANATGNTSTGNIFNNYLNLNGIKGYISDSVTMGIRLENSRNVDVIHNTVFFNEAGDSCGNKSLILSNLESCNVYNNIFNQNENMVCISLNTPLTNVYIDYNSYYNYDNGTLRFELLGKFVPEHTFRTSSCIGYHDRNSYFNKNSYFVKSNTYKLDSTQSILTGMVSGIEKDIEGQQRCKYRPVIGADECVLNYSRPVAKMNMVNLSCVKDYYLIKNSSVNPDGGYKWYCNDELVSENLQFKYSFDTAGTYKVKLVAENCSYQDSVIGFVVVKNVIADFSRSLNHIYAKIDTLSLYDLSSCYPDSINWNIEPNSIKALTDYPNGLNQKVIFLDTGMYKISLKAFKNGHIDIKEEEIEVRDSLIFYMNGQDGVSITQCSYYKDQGVVLNSVLGIPPPVLYDTSNLDVMQPGTYFYKYYFIHSKNQDTIAIERTITVLAEKNAPVINILGPTIDSVRIYDNYDDPGIQVFDSCSGVDSTVVNNHVNTSVVGVYDIEYICIDYNGNQARSFRQVKVYDDVAPEIQLKGDKYDTVGVYTSYNDPGVMATDNYCTQLRIKTYSNLDSSKLGAYFIVYYAEDCYGNLSDSVVRYVQVADLIAPVFYFTGPDTISVQDGNTGIVNSYLDSYYLQENYDVNLSPVYYGSYFSTYLANPSPGCYKVLGLVTDLSGNNSRPDSFFVNVKVNSIEEQNNCLNVQIYPNPNNGQFNIEIKEQSCGYASWVMVDISGQLIKKGDIYQAHSSISVPDVCSGVYCLKVICKEKSVVYKLIINK